MAKPSPKEDVMKLVSLSLAVALISGTALAQSQMPSGAGESSPSEQTLIKKRMGGAASTTEGRSVEGRSSTHIQGSVNVGERRSEGGSVSVRTRTHTTETAPSVSVQEDEPTTTIVHRKRVVHRVDPSYKKKVVVHQRRHYVEDPTIVVKRKRHVVRSYESEPSVSVTTRRNRTVRSYESEPSVSLRSRSETHTGTTLRQRSGTEITGSVSTRSHGSETSVSGKAQGSMGLQGTSPIKKKLPGGSDSAE